MTNEGFLWAYKLEHLSTYIFLNDEANGMIMSYCVDINMMDDEQKWYMVFNYLATSWETQYGDGTTRVLQLDKTFTLEDR